MIVAAINAANPPFNDRFGAASSSPRPDAFTATIAPRFVIIIVRARTVRRIATARVVAAGACIVVIVIISLVRSCAIPSLRRATRRAMGTRDGHWIFSSVTSLKHLESARCGDRSMRASMREKIVRWKYR
jgi:hypothetical protein